MPRELYSGEEALAMKLKLLLFLLLLAAPAALVLRATVLGSSGGSYPITSAGSARELFERGEADGLIIITLEPDCVRAVCGSTIRIKVDLYYMRRPTAPEAIVVN